MSTPDDDLAELLAELSFSPEDLAELLAEQASFDLPQLLAELTAAADADLDELLGVTCPGCGLHFLP